MAIASSPDERQAAMDLKDLTAAVEERFEASLSKLEKRYRLCTFPVCESTGILAVTLPLLVLGSGLFFWRHYR